jgi:hypothetical protein
MEAEGIALSASSFVGLSALLISRAQRCAAEATRRTP